MNEIVRQVTAHQLKEGRDHVKVGDGVRVLIKVREGGKERTQIFSGIIIAMKGSEMQRHFTVRRVVSGLGIERVFPLHSPNIEGIEVDRESVVRRSSKIYYMRKRMGKEAMIVQQKRFQKA